MGCNHDHMCELCGDRMIHQENRGWHESSSAFGQFVHGEFPTKVWFGDIDGYVLRRKDCEGPGCLRLLEVKKPGGRPSTGQDNLLPVLASAVAYAAPRAGYPDNGVFCLEWKQGEHRAIVTRYLPDGATKKFTVEGEQFRRLVTGLPSLKRVHQKLRVAA